MIEIKSSREIEQRLDFIAKKINSIYKNQTVELIMLNTTPIYFINDLTMRLNVDFNIQNLNFKNYENTSKSGEVSITKDLDSSIYGKNILLIEGIIISGLTPNYIVRLLKQRKPKSIAIACIGTKPKLLTKKLPEIFSLFSFNKEWVEGYGIGDSDFKMKRNIFDISKK